MTFSRRQMFQGMGVAAAASLAGSPSQRTTAEVHLVFHGMMIFEFRKYERQVWIHLPTVMPDSRANDPGHIYCITLPGDEQTRIYLKDVNTLTGVPAGYAEPDSNQDPILRRQQETDFAIDRTMCSCRLVVPWPGAIGRYRFAHRKESNGPIYNPDSYYFNLTSLPLVYVFEYGASIEPRINNDAGSIVWQACAGRRVAINVHAEPPGCGFFNHFGHLAMAFSSPLTCDIPNPCDFQEDSLPNGSSQQVGIPQNDFYGLPGPCPAPQCTSGRRPPLAAIPSNCSSIFVE